MIQRLHGQKMEREKQFICQSEVLAASDGISGSCRLAFFAGLPVSMRWLVVRCSVCCPLSYFVGYWWMFQVSDTGTKKKIQNLSFSFLISHTLSFERLLFALQRAILVQTIYFSYLLKASLDKNRHFSQTVIYTHIQYGNPRRDHLLRKSPWLSIVWLCDFPFLIAAGRFSQILHHAWAERVGHFVHQPWRQCSLWIAMCDVSETAAAIALLTYNEPGYMWNGTERTISAWLKSRSLRQSSAQLLSIHTGHSPS